MHAFRPDEEGRKTEGRTEESVKKVKKEAKCERKKGRKKKAKRKKERAEGKTRLTRMVERKTDKEMYRLRKTLYHLMLNVRLKISKLISNYSCHIHST